MKTTKLLLILGLLIVLGLVVHFPGRKLARAHVNSKTAVEDHPLLCTSCHLYTSKNTLISKLINADYYSPINLTVSKDGSRLYIVAQERDALLIVDPIKNKVLNKIRVGDLPHSVILSSDGHIAYVSNEWSDNVSVIDLATSQVVDTLKTGNGPAEISLSADGQFLYVVNSYSSSISVIDIETRQEVKRFNAGNNPTGTQLSPNGRNLIVTSRRALITPYGDTLKSELTVVDESTQRVVERLNIESAYMMENVAFTPTGDLAIVTLIRPKNLVPSIQVEQGWMMTYGIGIIEQKENGRVIQLLLDEPNAYYSDPFDIVITPDGKKAFISNSGVNCISVVNMDSIRSLIAGSSAETLRYLCESPGNQQPLCNEAYLYRGRSKGACTLA